MTKAFDTSVSENSVVRSNLEGESIFKTINELALTSYCI